MHKVFPLWLVPFSNMKNGCKVVGLPPAVNYKPLSLAISAVLHVISTLLWHADFRPASNTPCSPDTPLRECGRLDVHQGIARTHDAPRHRRPVPLSSTRSLSDAANASLVATEAPHPYRRTQSSVSSLINLQAHLSLSQYQMVLSCQAIRAVANQLACLGA